MSMYENNEKDEVFYWITEFLKTHSAFELLKIVADAVERKEEGYLHE